MKRTVLKLIKKARRMVIGVPRLLKGLQVDEVFSFGQDHQHTTKVGEVGEETK
jgi:hypothetical protein